MTPDPAKTRNPRTAPAAPVALALLLLMGGVAGCSSASGRGPYTALAGYQRDTTGDLGADASWPDLPGETLTILGNGAFPSCKQAAERFTALTRITVTCDNGHDAVEDLSALQQHPGQYDVVYGLDNALLPKATALGLLDPYEPRLGDRIDPSLIITPRFWGATPVDHGFIAVNVDTQASSNGNRSLERVTNLAQVRAYADLLVTSDPAKSSPGLGFLLTTIAKYGENPPGGVGYDWKAYWRDLFTGTKRPGHVEPPCVLVAANWGEAYEQHFTNGYGSATGASDKPLVVSYTESPAVEVYFGSYPAERRPAVVTEPGSVWHQIQTMGIVAGTRHRTAAEAWVEFTLTDHFQGLRAPVDAVYPVVASIDTSPVFGGLDPEPSRLVPARIDQDRIGANLDRWLSEWRALYESPDNCRT